MHQTYMPHGSAGAGLQPLAKHCTPDMARFKMKNQTHWCVQHDYSNSQRPSKPAFAGCRTAALSRIPTTELHLLPPLSGRQQATAHPRHCAPGPARAQASRPAPALPQGCAQMLRLSGARKSLAVSGRWTRRPATCTWRTLSKAASLRSQPPPPSCACHDCHVRSLESRFTHSCCMLHLLCCAWRAAQHYPDTSGH